MRYTRPSQLSSSGLHQRSQVNRPHSTTKIATNTITIDSSTPAHSEVQRATTGLEERFSTRMERLSAGLTLGLSGLVRMG